MAINEEHCFVYMRFFSHRHEPLLPEAGIRWRSEGHKVPLQRYIPIKYLCLRTEYMKYLEEYKEYLLKNVILVRSSKLPQGCDTRIGYCMNHLISFCQELGKG